ncbi:hypothetical protein RFI_34714 [Reticulomyxa filosa]|uniref:Uncharacterized protein n=1 Tax=Reticulomyxa filosa TaxID=46433 RepID=X6LMT7_RETFI|nr:hypothetical protein RFI_34714 [Reticulomyxa filosa]|eukprot:ETO02701.1 hypothetical protein RFI_34714 [Reticulomyxa filosa]
MNQSLIPHYNDLIFSRIQVKVAKVLTSAEVRDFAYVTRILCKPSNGLFLFEKNFLNSLNHFRLFDYAYFDKSAEKTCGLWQCELEADLYYFDLMKGVYVVEEREGKEMNLFAKKVSLFAEGYRFSYADYKTILRNESFFMDWFTYLEESDETSYLKYLLTRTPMDITKFLCKTYFWSLAIRYKDDQKISFKKKKDGKEEDYVQSLKDYYCECGCLFCLEEGYKKHLDSENPCEFAYASKKAFLLLNKLPNDIINILVDYIHPLRFQKKPNEKEQIIIFSLYKSYRYTKDGSPFLKVKKNIKMTEIDYIVNDDLRIGASSYCYVAKTFCD